MGPGFFVIAILGCADGGSACTPVTTLQTRYATQEQCSEATGAALIENSNFDFPTLVARCRYDNPKSADAQPGTSGKRRRG
jgi:acyl-CoA synthetase (AMP-forming)/AMP-acid ligase II